MTKPKYTLESYVDCGFYGFEDDEIEHHTTKVVKCRKEHICVCGCEQKINVGDYALCEKGFMDGKPVTIHTNCTCIDKWIDDLGGENAGFDLYKGVTRND